MWQCGGFGVCVCVLEWISGWVLGCVSVSVWVSVFVFLFRRDFELGFRFCLCFRFEFRAWVLASLRFGLVVLNPLVSIWVAHISALFIFIFLFYVKG